MSQHIPVLAKEVLDTLALSAGETVLDGTLGLGGHAAYMLEATAPDGTLIGFDRDARNLGVAKERLAEFGKRVTFVNDSFGNVAQYEMPQIDGALLDLGFSSVHVDDAARGFSFLREGPLDMRYDTRQEMSAETVVNHWSHDDLAFIFRAYGEEPKADTVARAIVEARKQEHITTTTQLATLVSSVIARRGKTHPATRIFQALRIAVNDELGELARGLEAVTARLAPGGRFAVITFHSLEDRVVKQFFRDDPRLRAVTKKPIVAAHEEVRDNPRARSAKLRVAQRQ